MMVGPHFFLSIEVSSVPSLELTDLDADRQLLALEGVSLLVFTSEGCASCRWARRHLPAMDLPIERLCWVDAGRNGGWWNATASFTCRPCSWSATAASMAH